MFEIRPKTRVHLHYFLPILTKIVMYGQILVKLNSTKFHENPLSGFRVFSCGFCDFYRLSAELRTRLKTKYVRA
jgi:hypothetical protein